MALVVFLGMAAFLGLIAFFYEVSTLGKRARSGRATV
jgi:hypothetical protein